MLHHEIQTLGDTLDVDLKDRISNIHTNAQSLDAQSKQLKTRTQQLNKTSRQWSSLAEGARGRLKVKSNYQLFEKL